MTPPPSINKESVGTKTISRFLSDLSAVCTGASQSFRPESAEETIEESKTEREKVKNKVFQAFPQLDHVKDLGIISEEEVNAIMPTEALGDLDMSLGSFMGVSYKIFEATNRRPSDLVLMYVGINSKQASPGAWITYQPPSMRYVTVRSFRSQLTQRRTSLRFPNGTTYMREFTATR